MIEYLCKYTRAQITVATYTPNARLFWGYTGKDLLITEDQISFNPDSFGSDQLLVRGSRVGLV